MANALINFHFDFLTPSLIELSWIAKNRIWTPTSLLLFCMLTACIEGLHGQGGQNLFDTKQNFFLLFFPRSPLLTQLVGEEEDRRWQSHEYKNVYSKVLI